MEQAWPDRYLSAESLRREVNAMVESVVEALLAAIPPSEIAGIYLKGSARKNWDSPVDYVPEFSDVDIHLLFRDPADIKRRLGTMETALDIQRRIENGYRARVSSPIHVPRPQLIVLNDILQDPDLFLSPRETVTTLYGEDYPAPESQDEQRMREVDRKNLLSHAPVLETLPLHVVDKPGIYVIAALRYLTWRVSPTGPRILSIMGTPSREAWSLNRTQIIPLLERSGEAGLAQDYRDFYLCAWEYFLSAYSDSAAARKAVAAGVSTLRKAAAIAEKIE